MHCIIPYNIATKCFSSKFYRKIACVVIASVCIFLSINLFKIRSNFASHIKCLCICSVFKLSSCTACYHCKCKSIICNNNISRRNICINMTCNIFERTLHRCHHSLGIAFSENHISLDKKSFFNLLWSPLIAVLFCITVRLILSYGKESQNKISQFNLFTVCCIYSINFGKT